MFHCGCRRRAGAPSGPLVATRQQACALSALVFVACSKTLLTKWAFIQLGNLPFAYSVLSCVVTNVCMLPYFACRPAALRVSRSQLPTLGLVCLAVAADLVMTNRAVALLSVALQQCIRSAAPAATLLVERLHGRARPPLLLVLTVGLLCVGPILTGLGSTSLEATPGGVLFMIAAVFAGAWKYVLAHQVITGFRREYGTLAFLFWVEWITAVILAPWAFANGEARALVEAAVFNAYTRADWALLFGTAAYGGVRIFTQFHFLALTSATSLAASNLAVQACTILLSTVLFHAEATPMLSLGVTITVTGSALYTWIKAVWLPRRERDAARCAALTRTFDDEAGSTDSSAEVEADGDEADGEAELTALAAKRRRAGFVHESGSAPLCATRGRGAASDGKCNHPAPASWTWHPTIAPSASLQNECS